MSAVAAQSPNRNQFTPSFIYIKLHKNYPSVIFLNCPQFGTKKQLSSSFQLLYHILRGGGVV